LLGTGVGSTGSVVGATFGVEGIGLTVSSVLVVIAGGVTDGVGEPVVSVVVAGVTPVEGTGDSVLSGGAVVAGLTSVPLLAGESVAIGSLDDSPQATLNNASKTAGTATLVVLFII